MTSQLKVLCAAFALLLALTLSSTAQAQAYKTQNIFPTANVGATVTVGTFTLPQGNRYAMLTYTTTNCSACSHQVAIDMQDGDGTWVIFDAYAAETTNTTRRALFSGTALALGANASNILAVITKPFPPVYQLRIIRTSGVGTVDINVSVTSW